MTPKAITTQTKVACLVTVLLLLCQASSFAQSFVGNLNGVSNNSTFDPGSSSALPAQGWVNISGTAQVFDGAGGNGALVHLNNEFANFEVQYDTGVAIQPLSSYTLQFDMGFLAAIGGGNASYSFQLGTLNNGSFTGLGSPETGTVNYAGNLTGGIVSGPDQQGFVTGSSVSGDNLAVRWQQTANPGPSDFFAFDNVKLSVAPVPEPGTFSFVLLGSLLMSGLWWRRIKS